VGSTPQGPYGKPPSGQPAAMQPGDFTPAAPRPRLFGEGEREFRGVPKLIVVPNPAAGADWTYKFSGPSWYLLRFGLATLTTSAVAGNRPVALVVTYTGIQCGAFIPNLGQIASQVFVYNFANTSSITSIGPFVPLQIPPDILLKDSMTLGSSTSGILAGDQWSGIALYVEEFTDKCLELL
jgi:hypothetical protein